jgi:hypothetical protein
MVAALIQNEMESGKPESSGPRLQMNIRMFRVELRRSVLLGA